MNKPAHKDSAAPLQAYSERPETLDEAPRASRSKTFLRGPDYIPSAWATIVIVISINWLWAERVGFKFSGYLPVGSAVTALAAIGCVYGFSGRNRKLAELGHYCALWIAFPVAVNMYSYVIATLRLPLRDAILGRMDAALGFNWLVWSARVGPHPILWLFLGNAYNSIYLQVFASIAFFSLTGREDRNRQLLWTSMVAALITVTLSGLLPAYGPFTNGKMPEWSAVLQAIRDGNVTNFKIADMKGIVAFPSFHTVLAILLVYAHRPPARTFVPVAILNLLMLVAIPFAGHHYLVDMIAGTLVAIVSIAGVNATMPPREVLRDAYPPLHSA